ncbi:MAG: sigma-70 family RNA polymerase sigma factor [Phycisphaeraceae bacterium]
MPLTEDQLVAKARKGDRQAMGELLSNYHNRLFNVALRMVSDREDAAELTQDAMLKIVQHLDGYDGRSQLSTWMIRITMNLSISHLRKRRLRKTASLDAQTGGDDGTDAGSSPRLGGRLTEEREPNPDACVEKSEMIAELHLAMDRLDEEFRAVLVLRDINDMDYKEIADVLEVPVGTVKSRLFRARVALRQEMSKTYPELREPSSVKPE